MKGWLWTIYQWIVMVVSPIKIYLKQVYLQTQGAPGSHLSWVLMVTGTWHTLSLVDHGVPWKSYQLESLLGVGPHTCPSYRLVEIKTCTQGQENMSALICNRKWKMKRWAKKGNIKFINNKQWSSLTLTKVKNVRSKQEVIDRGLDQRNRVGGSEMIQSGYNLSNAKEDLLMGCASVSEMN